MAEKPSILSLQAELDLMHEGFNRKLEGIMDDLAAKGGRIRDGLRREISKIPKIAAYQIVGTVAGGVEAAFGLSNGLGVTYYSMFQTMPINVASYALPALLLLDGSCRLAGVATGNKRLAYGGIVEAIVDNVGELGSYLMR